jgi:hypothetical protein
MMNAEIRKGFDKAAEAHRANGNFDQAANLDLAREYFTNPTFRKALEDHVWALTQAQSVPAAA